MAVDIGLVVDREIEGFLGFVIGVGVDLGVDLGVDEGVGVVRGVVIGVGKGVGDDLGVVTGDAIGVVKGELFLKIENPVDWERGTIEDELEEGEVRVLFKIWLSFWCLSITAWINLEEKVRFVNIFRLSLRSKFVWLNISAKISEMFLLISSSSSRLEAFAKYSMALFKSLLGKFVFFK